MGRMFYYADCNNAFISWASVESLKNGGPDFRLVPSVVSRKPGTRGAIVAAVSQPAKKLGVKVPQPLNQALALCPNLVIVEPDFDTYRKYSQQFKDICRSFADRCEDFFIDECAFTVKPEIEAKVPPEIIAVEIRKRIKKQLDIDVTIGIANTKSFAKICSDFKPSGVYMVTEDTFRDFLWPLPVERLMYCGPKTTSKLNTAGILTIGELASTELKYIKEVVGNKPGEFLWLQANGMDNLEIITEHQTRKSLSVERTVQVSITDIKELKASFEPLVEEAMERLNKENLLTAQVGIKLRKDNFEESSFSKSTSEPVSSPEELSEVISFLIDENYRNGTSIRQIGVKLGKISSKQ